MANFDLLKSDFGKQKTLDLVEAIFGIISKDPISAISLVNQIIKLPMNIRDEIFWENFACYLYNVCRYRVDENTEVQLDFKYKKRFLEVLSEELPNTEAGYSGNPEKLHENIKRVVKLIDDAGTFQKSVYYANLTRALLNEEITKNRFFKLCRCINNLTEEDLVYFKADITKNGKSIIKEDRDIMDDFRSVGLLMEVDK